MKKKIRTVKTALLSAFAAVVVALGAAATVTGCADADGLHDQQALMVTFVFTGFGDDINGNYAIPGNFNGDASSWERGITTADVTLKGGEGTSNAIAVTGANIQFTLVPVNDSAWARPWYRAGSMEGNADDKANGGAMWNFCYDGLDVDAGEATLVIDGRKSGEADMVYED